MTETVVRRDVPGLVGCACAIAIGIAAIAFSGDFSPLGAVFPRTISGVMIALAVLYAFFALRRPRRVAVMESGSTPRRAGVIVVMLVWAFALQPVGFLFTSTCATFALLLIAQYNRWSARTALIYGFSLALVIGLLYLLFSHVLQVPLPVGVFL